jgi:hypothetical protein
VLSVVVSFLACPLISGWLLAALRDGLHLSGAVVPDGTAWVIVLAMCIAGIALIRITGSKTRIKGVKYAYFAFVLCVIWMAMNLLLDHLLSNMRFGPGD